MATNSLSQSGDSRMSGDGGTYVGATFGACTLCTVCGRGGIKLINATGLLWKHGPCDNMYSGSQTKPLHTVPMILPHTQPLMVQRTLPQTH